MLLITIIHLLLAIETVTNVIYQIMILKLGQLELIIAIEGGLVTNQILLRHVLPAFK